MNTYIFIGLIVTCIACLVSGITLLAIYLPKRTATPGKTSSSETTTTTEKDKQANSETVTKTFAEPDEVKSPADTITAKTKENKVQDKKVNTSKPGNSTVEGLMELERQKMLRLVEESNKENERQLEVAKRIREQAAAEKAASDASNTYCIIAEDDGRIIKFTQTGDKWIGPFDKQAQPGSKFYVPLDISKSTSSSTWVLRRDKEYIGQRMARRDKYKDTRPADGLWYGKGGTKIGMGGPC